MGRVVDASVTERVRVRDRKTDSPRPVEALPSPASLRAQYIAEIRQAPPGLRHASDRLWLEQLRQEATERGVQLLPNVYVPMLPSGWRLLIVPLKAAELSDGGIALPDDVQRSNQLLEYRGWVVAMGPACYTSVKFGGQRWCQLGDLIAYLPYESATYDVNLGGERGRYIIINDDDVRAVITDPTVLKTYV